MIRHAGSSEASHILRMASGFLIDSEGPVTYQQAMNWPIFMVQDVCRQDPVAAKRLIRAITGPIDVASVFSGLGNDVFSLFRLRSHAVTASMDVPRGLLRFVSATDVGAIQQQVLCSFTPDERPNHVFGCVLERLPPQLRSQLLEVVPKKHDDPSLHQAGFQKMLKLFQSYTDAFGDMTTDDCAKHGRSCGVYSAPQSAAEPVLAVHWAGSVCTDFAALGLRHGMCGPFSILFLAWAFERRARRETLVFHECTAQFPLELLNDVFGDLYEVDRECVSVIIFASSGSSPGYVV